VRRNRPDKREHKTSENPPVRVGIDVASTAAPRPERKIYAKRATSRSTAAQANQNRPGPSHTDGMLELMSCHPTLPDDVPLSSNRDGMHVKGLRLGKATESLRQVTKKSGRDPRHSDKASQPPTSSHNHHHDREQQPKQHILPSPNTLHATTPGRPLLALHDVRRTTTVVTEKLVGKVLRHCLSPEHPLHDGQEVGQSLPRPRFRPDD